MGKKKITKFRDLIGIIKDKASQTKAALISNPTTLSISLSLLRATSHDAFSPPNDKHLAYLLYFGGNGSRATAATLITVLMERLHSTHDFCVAIKCLITVHHIIKHGSFILQDQLSVFPSSGGRNYLNLSNFRDCSSPIAWEISSLVRWYACYLDQLLSTSRVLGFFLSSCSSSSSCAEDKVSALINIYLIKEIDSLTQLIEQLSNRSDSVDLHGNNLVSEVINLVSDDYLSAINEASVRINEFRERTSCLSFAESVELICTLKRLEDCKERLTVLYDRKKAMVETFWSSIMEVKDKVGEMEKVYREERRSMEMGKRRRWSESARFGNRVLMFGDSFRFSSGRFFANSAMDVGIDSL